MLQHCSPIPAPALRTHSTAVALAHTELSVVPLVGKKNPEDILQRPLTPCPGGQPALVSKSFAKIPLQCIRVFAICFLHIDLSESVSRGSVKQNLGHLYA